MNKTFFTNTFLAILTFVMLTSGIIRDDVKERKYFKLANEKQFDAVGQIYLDTAARGSCVLINERFVLTAAHVFIVSDHRLDTMLMFGQTITVYTPINQRVVDFKRLSVVIGGQTMKVKNLILHPTYLDSISQGKCDLAILELEVACKGVNPAIVNKNFDELNANVVGVGYGVSGIASKPETVVKVDKKTAGQNTIDSIAGFKYLGQATLLMCDFDHPNLPDCNKMGSAVPQPLEYICGGGDSGGGLFRQKNKQWELIGICQSSSTDVQQLLKTGYYGQTMSWTRVAAFQKWIADYSK